MVSLHCSIAFRSAVRCSYVDTLHVRNMLWLYPIEDSVRRVVGVGVVPLFASLWRAFVNRYLDLDTDTSLL